MSKIINGVASEYDMPTSRCKTLEDLVNNYETRLKYNNYEFDELSYKLLIIDLKKILQENKQLKDAIEKVRKIIEQGLDFDNPYYADKCEEKLLQILDKVKIGDKQ